MTIDLQWTTGIFEIQAMESLFKVLFLVIMIVTVSTFRTLFLIGISQQDYRAAVRAGADIVWFCPSCSRPDADPVAESTRISESETDILESEEFNPPLPSSDSDFFLHFDAHEFVASGIPFIGALAKQNFLIFKIRKKKLIPIYPNPL